MTLPAPSVISSEAKALEAVHVLQTYKRAPVVFVRGEGVYSSTRPVAGTGPDLGGWRRVAGPRPSGPRRGAE